MRITFDTNSLMDLFLPKPTQRPELQPAAARVRNALADGTLQGFFCESVLTLEGVMKPDRKEVFGLRQARKPLDPKFGSMIQRAKAFGLRAVRAPKLLGFGWSWADEDGTLFVPDGSINELIARMDRTNELATAVSRRGFGYARAVTVGRGFADCANPAQPVIWCKGLPHAGRRRVNRAIAEWSDGNSIAAHYGYGNDLFCTEDTSGLFDDVNRQWLANAYGVRFTTLDSLAEMV
jgi:hypothetical protein